MLKLDVLLRARDEYENSFATDNYVLLDIVERLSDRDLELSSHVFVAKFGDRRLQITLTEDELSSAFLKKTGYPLEIDLMHLHVNISDLRIEECRQMFGAWLIDRSELALGASLAEQFNQNNDMRKTVT